MIYPTVRLKFALSANDGGAWGEEPDADSGTPVLRSTDITVDGHINVSNPALRRLSSREIRSTKLHTGDILVVKSSGSSAHLGKSGWADERCSGMAFSNFVQRLRFSKNFDRRYAWYFLNSTTMKNQVTLLSSTTTGLQNLSASLIREIEIPAPHLDEQHRIAEFLDVEMVRFDHLRRLRETQRAAITERFRAVLDATFEDHQTASLRLKNLLRARPRYGVLVPEFVDDGTPLVRINDLSNLDARIDELPRIPDSLSRQYRRTIVQSDDVLVSVVGTLGRSAVASPSLVGTNVNRAIAILRAREGVTPYLLSAWIQTSAFEDQAMLATGNDSAQRTLGMEDLANFKVSWPTSVAEQRKLAAQLADTINTITSLRSTIDTQLRTLSERRAALIAAAVTGQFDVTTAGASVPTEGGVG